jgi:hypothetical protein
MSRPTVSARLLVMSGNRMTARLWLTAIVAAHLIISIVHGAAHSGAHVLLSRVANLGTIGIAITRSVRVCGDPRGTVGRSGAHLVGRATRGMDHRDHDGRLVHLWFPESFRVCEPGPRGACRASMASALRDDRSPARTDGGAGPGPGVESCAGKEERVMNVSRVKSIRLTLSNADAKAELALASTI